VGGNDDIEMVGQKRREDMAEKDRMALLSSLNSARGLQGCVRLEYDPLLFNGMLGHLSTTEDILEGGDVTKNLDMHVRHLQPTILTAIPVGATEGQRGVMIVSPPVRRAGLRRAMGWWEVSGPRLPSEADATCCRW